MFASRSRRNHAAAARSARSSAPAATAPATTSSAIAARRPLPRRSRRRPAGRCPHRGAARPRAGATDERGGGPISRVLFAPTRTGPLARPGRRRGGPSFIWRARRRLTAPAPHSSSLPAGSTAASLRDASSRGEQPNPLLGFAPGEVCRTSGVAAGVVGSYPTVSPLPNGPPHRGAAVRRSVLCGTVCRPRRGADARALPGALLYGARTFLRAGYRSRRWPARLLRPPR